MSKERFIASIAREYIEVIEQMLYGQFHDQDELYYLESQRVLLHQQLRELLGYEPSVAQARALVLLAQAEGEY